MRSTTGWNQMVIMLALAALGQAARAQTDGVGPAVGGAAAAVGQTPSGRAKAYSALSNGINHYRKKDFESAAKLFLEAQRGQDFLSPQHRQELSRYVLLNKTALQSQREGLDLLKAAEDAVNSGRVQEADRVLKALEGNQFLSAADRQKAQQLSSRLRPIEPASMDTKQPDKVAQMTLARAKLSQARQLLNKGEFKTAEAIAVEVAKLPNTLYDLNEDTPKKLLDDIANIKKDGKALLRMSRVALSRGDVDRAEELAQQAKEVGGNRRLFNIFGDTPEKVLRDVEDARQKPGAAPKEAPPVKEANKSPSRFEIFKGLNPFNRGTGETPVVEEPKPEAAPKDQSRRFPLLPAFLTGRKADEEKADSVADADGGSSPYGSIRQAGGTKLPEPPGSGVGTKLPEPPSSGQGSRLPEPRDTQLAKLPEPPSPSPIERPQAQGKLPEPPAQTPSMARLPEPPQRMPEGPKATPLPDRSVAQAPRAMPISARKPETTPVKSVGRLPEPPAQTAQAPKNRPEGSAQQLLESAREAMQQGDTAKAKMLVARARALNARYNWWEESPDRVAADIARAELGKGPAVAQGNGVKPANLDDRKYTRDDAVKMLADARKQLRAAKLDEAEQLTVKARTIAPGGWGLFEDSPDKLMQDLQRARVRQNKAESVRLLAEARQALDKGSLDEAKSKAVKAERLHGPYSVWDFGDRPQKLITEIEVAQAKERKKNGNKPVENPGSSPYQGRNLPEGIELAEVRRLPHQARQAIDKGDFDTALKLATNVERMGFSPSDKPDEITPAFIRKQVELAQGKTPESAKKQAQQLIVQARTLQREHKLLEARQKVMEAQNLGATYLPEEERPEKVLLDLAAVAVKRIEFHTQLAVDQMAMSSSDPAALKRAEDELNRARELAAGFSLDTQPIEQKLAALQQTRNGSAIAGVFPQMPGRATVTDPIPSVGGEPSEPAGPGTPEQQGLMLLNKARAEIRSGRTGQARRMAEEVFKGPYGLRAAAEDLLRNIDVEEHKQRVSMHNHFFDAMKSAYIRGEIAQAAAIGKTIDLGQLDAERRVRFKEIMSMPNMQQAMAKGDTPIQPPEPIKPVGVGQATATDQPPPPPNQPRPVSPADTYAQQVAAMQEIKFQKLRDESLGAQRDAIERFRAGSTEEALELLKRYLLGLDDAGLDPARAAMLRKPVEARLEQFKTLKVQNDLAALKDRDSKSASAVSDKLRKADELKKQGVAELMGQYKTFYKEGKYREAQMAAMKAHELDPDNVAADAATHIAEIMANQVRFDKIKKNKERMFVNALDDVEDFKNFADDEFPVKFDKKRWETIKNRPGFDSIMTGPKKSPKELEIERSLSQSISFDFKNKTLFDALEELQGMTGINIVPDEAALKEAGIRGDAPLTLRLEAISLKSALSLLLDRSHLTYIVKNEVLLITTPEKARGKLSQKTYQVADLVIPVENFTLSPNQNLATVLDRVANQPGMNNMNGGGAVTPFTGPRSLQGGQQASSPGDNALQPSPLGGALSPGGVPRKPGQTLEEALIKLITNTIEPRSWSDMGGPGTIDYFPLGMALVINQTPDIQEQVQELLNALRRLQDLEVAIEVRFISLAESFYERIGLDFLMEIQPDTTKFEPQITSGVFRPPGYVNDFSPTNFVAGISPAGTAPNQSLPAFTHDLDIPIKSTSFLPAVPPFGGFPIAPGADGGLSLGLAFLSDIQVFLFLEAAQGDVRTNIMQAPKLTMFNAQTATITINDTNFFVTGNIIGLFNGQVVFNPQNTPFPLGVTMTLQPVVSADRRFVRVSLAPTLTNLTTPIAALFPFTTIVTPVFDTGVVGQPIPITQFIQQPSFTTVGVQTTVSVPDGGTVLLGGLKTLQEGRNEFGPPILSKLPYINRLFKNVGYGRNVNSHMIMVTPRIIINEEEEQLQTGVGVN